ncbi:MAG TPA: hypothetical protein VG934_00885 [Candidatus Paceibacterota bacterium]|nr:hypothetical protein [Candidatus Paceibacterota bacterium]
MSKRGFTAFFAVLVASLALAVGLAIYDLLSRELALSQVATQSQYAIFAADTGAECALYWDNKYTGATAPSVFGTSSTAAWGASPINCNGIDITTKGPPAVDWSSYTDPTLYNCPSSPGSAWCIASSANAATTTFSMTMTSGSQTVCATVVVAKVGNPAQTIVTSHGYNTCSAGGVRIERALQVNY